MSRHGHFPQTRLRRLRQKANLRELVRETRLDLSRLVLPLFIRHGENIKKPIESMPWHYQISVDRLPEEITAIAALGIKNIILFGIPAQKDPLGKDAYSDNGIIQTAIPVIKKITPTMLVISDICFPAES